MKRQTICGIYKIENNITSKCYIGLSIDCLSRLSRHKSMLRHNKHTNCHLQAAWNKYGEDAFSYEIIEECSRELLPEREIYWISYYDSFHNGYNRSGGGDGTTDVIYSEERGKKISEKLSGRVRPDCAGANAWNARHVVCLNNGETFRCAKDAAERYKLHYEGVLRSCELGCTVGKIFVFAYEEDYVMLSSDDIRNMVYSAVINRLHGGRQHRVVCLNTGSIYNGLRDASIVNGGLSIKNILNCCKGRNHSCGKTQTGEPMVWMFEEDYKKLSEDEIVEKLKREISKSPYRPKVYCSNIDHIFPSTMAAARYFGISNVHMSAMLKQHGEYAKEMPNGEVLKFIVA